VCGNRSARDVRLAIEAGADAVGFVVASPESPRDLAPSQAAALAARAGPFVQTVLVTREAQPARLAALQGACGMDALQVHGVRDAGAARAVRKAVMGKLVLAVGVREGAVALARELGPHADALLLDTPRADGRTGGAGEVHDWRTSARIVRALATPAILAGGLTPRNVGEAIAAVKPYAVDVSSGVEDARGAAKSAARVSAFVREVRRVG
jgi:phosphoribosylanthranilate isomerase